jgi:hypothetical protein
MRHVLFEIGILIALGAFVFAVNTTVPWLLTRGGAPSQENGTLHYRIRPGMRLLAGVIGGLGLWAMVTGFRQLRRPNDLLCLLELFGGLAMVFCAAFMLTARISLDEGGLHYRRRWKSLTSIGWAEFDHYEVRADPKINTLTVFFRSVDSRTIAVEEAGYDVADLLQRIVARTHLQERPYTRRHWYGG